MSTCTAIKTLPLAATHVAPAKLSAQFVIDTAGSREIVAGLTL